VTIEKIMSIASVVKTLSTVPPPPAASAADVLAMAADILAGRKPRNMVNGLKAIYGRVVALETQMGKDPSAFTLNSPILATRLVELEALAAQHLAPAAPAAPTTPAVQVALPAAAPATVATVATVEAAAGILTATLAEFRRMDASTASRFAQNGGALCRSDFEALPAAARMAHCKAGGKVIDAPGTVARRYAPGVVEAGAPMERTGEFARNGTALTRAEFDKLKPAGQMQFMRAGGKLTD